MKAYNRGKSEAQANAEALARRGMPYSEAHQVSVSVAYDWTKRQPRDLRDAVRMVRRAYADEVPSRLTEGPGSVGDDGNPRFAPEATSYIFGDPGLNTDAGKTPEVVNFFHAPFRARLDGMEHGDLAARKHAAIVRHVTIGSMDAIPATIKEDVPVWCAGQVALIALTSFLSGLSDLSLNVARRSEAA